MIEEIKVKILVQDSLGSSHTNLFTLNTRLQYDIVFVTSRRDLLLRSKFRNVFDVYYASVMA